jgi:hypothetical protein|tara:strand:- start:315 stop:641 length:327 start_codon:yes stop_codon:yes gene_type:complete
MSYGKKDKRISFVDTDKRIADFIVRLKHDGLTKTKFFKSVLSGYLDMNPLIMEFVDQTKEEIQAQSISKSNKIKKARENGQSVKNKFALDDGEIENIFDMLEKEHPDL